MARPQSQHPRRPLAYDVTHIVTRLPTAQSSGIDKVDHAFARHAAQLGCETLVHYGSRRPRFHAAAALPRLLEGISPQAASAGLGPVYRWLTGSEPPEPATGPAAGKSLWSRRAAFARWRMAPGSTSLGQGAIYLNVAQHAFEHAHFFNWLDHRPDVVPVFFVHDVLPLDWPEYFRAGYRDRFERRWQTIERRARALITTTNVVRQRLEAEFEHRRLPSPPIHVAALPSPLADCVVPPDPRLQSVNYFVVVGTIEPRKNHLLLLNIWRRLAQEQAHPPRLVIIGARGWENEQVVDVLDRSVLVRPHVFECKGLGDAALATLIGNARGLLMPSFAEGYGLPVVEALSLGTPVIASDIPVFHEVGQDRAIYRHPLDGPGWREAILRLAATTPSQRTAADADQTSFRAPTWSNYFEGIRGFLSSL